MQKKISTRSGIDGLGIYKSNAKLSAAAYDAARRTDDFKKHLPDVAWMTADLALRMAGSAMACLADLVDRVAEIEEKGVVYRGSFNQSDEYKRGDLVSHGGSIFHATRATQGIRPTHCDEQKAPDHPWQLAVKRGRDAR
jgi:hypothetical protein